jgi:hypothetical protein
MTNFKAMQTEIYKQLDARAPVPQQTPDGQAVQQAPAAGGGGILGALLNNPQIAEKLIDKFLGGGQAAQQSTTEIILKAWLQGLSAGNKLKVGQVTPDELLSNVNTILNPANPGAVNPPAAPAK